jgi:hypothetical protein
MSRLFRGQPCTIPGQMSRRSKSRKVEAAASRRTGGVNYVLRKGVNEGLRRMGEGYGNAHFDPHETWSTRSIW